MTHRIHIISTKPEICTLIKKALAKYDYIISCNTGDSLTASRADSGYNEKIDCLIIDSDINPRIREKAEEVFSNSFVIYLPVLDSSENSHDNANDISAPLKLSELSERLDNLFKVNKS